MIHVQKLGKRYGECWALQDMTFEVRAGEFVGILGRNGAGKTTLVRILTGQLAPTTGEAEILGLSVAARPLELRRRIGVMPEPTALLDGLTGAQYLHFVGRIHGLAPMVLDARIGELGDLLELDFRSPARIGDYSVGMKKKVALCAAVLHAPELLFLDEPFEGLDPVSAETLRGLLESLRDHGATILMTSHLLGTAERLCDRFLLLDQGRILRDGAAGELLQGATSLEEFFLGAVGRPRTGVVSWM